MIDLRLRLNSTEPWRKEGFFSALICLSSHIGMSSDIGICFVVVRREHVPKLPSGEKRSLSSKFDADVWNLVWDFGWNDYLARKLGGRLGEWVPVHDKCAWHARPSFRPHFYVITTTHRLYSRLEQSLKSSERSVFAQCKFLWREWNLPPCAGGVWDWALLTLALSYWVALRTTWLLIR